MKNEQVRIFRQVLRRFERLVTSQLKDMGCCSGVSLAQCHALLEIEIQGPLGLNDLSQNLNLDKSTLSRTIDGLVNIGLVQRDPNPADRRSVIINLTPQGRNTCDQINKINDALFLQVIDHIPPENRETVLKSFKLLVDAMALEEKCSCRQPVTDADAERKDP